MLGVGGIQPPPPPSTPPYMRPRKTHSATNIFPFFSSIQVCKTDFPTSQLSFPTCPLSLGRSGLCLFAQNKRRNGGGGGNVDSDVMEEEGFEEGEEFDAEDDDYDSEDVDDGDDLDVIVPVDELDGWLQRKPRGFGEGKVYDTSIEDKLLEEIEQSRRAQLANINKLKNLSSEPKKQLNEEPESVPSGACVRISQLPKKKNILRDLKTAFKGISGIVNITPVNLGNRKTKDPICKGLAFVDFKSLEDARRFIDKFSGQNVTFGKIDKQITCELLKKTYSASQKTINDPNVEAEYNADSDDMNGFWPLHEEDDFEESWDSDSGDEGVTKSSESFNAVEIDGTDEIAEIEQKMKLLDVSPSSTHQNSSQAAVKLKSAGRRREGFRPSSVSELDDTNEIERKMLLAASSRSTRKNSPPATVKVKSVGRGREGSRPSSLSELDDTNEIDEIERKIKLLAVSPPSTRKSGPPAAVKGKSAGSRSANKSTTSKIPRSAKRLQLREKAMLADVFSRYGSKLASTSKES